METTPAQPLIDRLSAVPVPAPRAEREALERIAEDFISLSEAVRIARDALAAPVVQEGEREGEVLLDGERWRVIDELAAERLGVGKEAIWGQCLVPFPPEEGP